MSNLDVSTPDHYAEHYPHPANRLCVRLWRDDQLLVVAVKTGREAFRDAAEVARYTGPIVELANNIGANCTDVAPA